MGGGAYENQRIHFNKIVEKYKGYIDLYKMINNGSAQGATNFGAFYQRMTYYTNYSDPTDITQVGY